MKQKQIHYYHSGFHGANTKVCCKKYYSEDVLATSSIKNVTCKSCVKNLTKQLMVVRQSNETNT